MTFRTESGGRIDRARPLQFTFDGQRMTGLQGDTLASALLANGVHLMGRSFKYHRPRGVVAAGPEEPNALMRISRPGGPSTPNLRASTIALFDGLAAESQNRFPSLRFDVGAAADWISGVLPAGFYYKTFMGPGGAWHRLWEPLIRRAAGLGRAPQGEDPDRYAHRFAHADVLVVGAGPAGLAAARAAAAAGARVLLCDEQTEPGGWLLSAPSAMIEGAPAMEWAGAVLAKLAANDRVTILPRTTAFGHFPHSMVGLVQRLTDHLAAPPPDAPRERMWMVRARQVVFAAGAIERPLVFAGNDRPGVMLAGAAQSFLHRYGVRVGRRAVIVTAHDAAYQAALDLVAAGVEVPMIAELRDSGGAWQQQAVAAGIKVSTGMRVAGTSGRLRVAGINLVTSAGHTYRLACDAVLMSGGFTPSVHLHSQARGRLAFDPTLGAYAPDGSVEPVRSAGACRGVFGMNAAAQDGARAGAAAALCEPGGQPQTSPPPGEAGGGGLIGVATGMPGGRRFVDFQNDVTDKDLALALREGFRSIEHVKRYTTTGMATDQGKLSNMNTLGIVAAAREVDVPAVGLTTFRMPYTPTSFGAFAGYGRGSLFDPVRQTPTHDQAVALGAVFEDVGQWKRAHHFPRRSETMHEAVARECLAVRGAVGMFDASTLGKIEVCGPDAAEFLERIYVNPWKKLAPGCCRYGIMLRESGFVMDDGVVGRLAPDRFHVTTTTGGAASVLALMEDYLQTEWSDLHAWLTSTTEQWATIAVQGPKARAVVAAVVDGVDLDALPHMGVAHARIAGIAGRLFRVSFTGELGYELNVPAGHGAALWDQVAAAGAPHGITPYGTEAMHVLRAEKGYIIVGQDSDGTATPDDLGLGWAVGKAKRDFVGMRSIAMPAMRQPGRKQLVGLDSLDGRSVLTEGAQLVAPDAPRTAIGHVTSAYRSPTLGRPIALAMLENGRARLGETLTAPLLTNDVGVRVVAPVFLDPAGERLNG
jgi:sarcosine oxidase subunit alpha